MLSEIPRFWEKQKRKINIFFLFFPPKPFLSSTTAVLQIHLYTYVLRLCAVSLLRWGKGHTYIVKNVVLDWENAFHWEVLLCKQELIFIDDSRYKNNAEYHFKQQLLIQVARHVNCNKKQQLKKLEGKDAGWSCTEHNRRDEE